MFFFKFFIFFGIGATIRTRWEIQSLPSAGLKKIIYVVHTFVCSLYCIHPLSPTDSHLTSKLSQNGTPIFFGMTSSSVISGK